MVRNGQVLAAIAGGSEAVFAEGLLRAWEAIVLFRVNLAVRSRLTAAV